MTDHFIVGRQGDTLEPDGYSLQMSKVLVTLIRGHAPEYAARIISVIGRYLNRVQIIGEDPRSVLDEPIGPAVDRFKGFMTDQGYSVVPSRKPNRADEFEIIVPASKSTAHAMQLTAIVRQFFQLCGSFAVGNRTAENPIELPGWHSRAKEKNRESCRDGCARRAHGRRDEGLRFRPAHRKTYPPLIEDPTGCATAMTKAVIAYDCPATVIAICIVLEENGCRWREAAWANALGWSVRGFGQIALTTNKSDAREHAKAIVLDPSVLSDIIRRFECQRHPTDPTQTMMDHLRELAVAREDHQLRTIPLFPNRVGQFHQHRTFNGYWFRPAMKAWKNEDGSFGLRIFSGLGSSRHPTPHWYRHSAITRCLEREIVDLASDLEILETSKAVCRRFGLKTDQAARYAFALMHRLAQEAHQRSVLTNRAENGALRKRVDIPLTLPRQEVSEAEQRICQLPARHSGLA